MSQEKGKLPPTPQSNLQASQSTFHEPPWTPTPFKKRGLSEENTIHPNQKRVKIGSGNSDFSESTLQSVHNQMQYDPGKEMPQTPQRVQGQRFFTTPSHGQSQGSSYDPDAGSSGSQETIGGEEIKELSSESIEEMVRSLGSLPAYIRKLERRKIAAEKSRDAKTNKIKSLEAEVERYVLSPL